MTYESQCVAAVQAIDGTIRRCSRDSDSTDPNYLTLIPVCSWHYTKARRQFAAPLEDEVTRLKSDAAAHECEGQAAIEAYELEQYNQSLGRAERHRKASQVYYMRCGEFIKIGVSISPLYRLRTIRETGGVLYPAGLDLSKTILVASEPGTQEKEAAMHVKFSHLRHAGEWFTETPELTDHINAVLSAGHSLGVTP